MRTHFAIGAHTIGAGRPFLIAEVAQAHDGSLGSAHAFIDAAAACGADAIKFQTHIAAAESTTDEPFRVRFSEQDATRLDYWRRMEFTGEQWVGLKAHADKAGLVFLSSPFSLAAVELLERVGVPAWKVASGEIFSVRMLQRLCATGIPLLLSTGMASHGEVARAVDAIRPHGRDIGIFQCTTKYPTPLEEVGINVIDELRERFRVPVGLSDHSGTVYPALMAMARGADLIEVHITLSKLAFGPDVTSSLDLEQMRLVAGARGAFAHMAAHPLRKDELAAALDPLKTTFGRSWALGADRPAGSVLGVDDLVLKKPGTGFREADLERLIGRRLARAVPASRLIREEDLEPGH